MHKQKNEWSTIIQNLIKNSSHMAKRCYHKLKDIFEISIWITSEHLQLSRCYFSVKKKQVESYQHTYLVCQLSIIIYEVKFTNRVYT